MYKPIVPPGSAHNRIADESEHTEMAHILQQRNKLFCFLCTRRETVVGEIKHRQLLQRRKTRKRINGGDTEGDETESRDIQMMEECREKKGTTIEKVEMKINIIQIMREIKIL